MHAEKPSAWGRRGSRGNQQPEKARPIDRLERLENRKSGVTEATGEFEWPHPLALMMVLRLTQPTCPASRSKGSNGASARSNKRSDSREGRDRPHFARQLAHVPGKEMLVFPVEAGRAQEALPIEIGADAGLDAGDMVHQDELPAPRAVRLEQSRDVAAVGKAPTMVLPAERIHFEHAAARPRRRSAIASAGSRIRRRSDRNPKSPRRSKAYAAIVFKPISETASAHDLEAVCPELVLKRAEPDGFKNRMMPSSRLP